VIDQVQGSPRECSEEQQEPGQEAGLQTTLQVHPGDRGRGRTGDKLPTTKV